MSALHGALDELFLFLGKAGQTPPVREVRVLEVDPYADLDERGRLRVRRDQFREPQAYEGRFDDLLASGLPWINISCCGVDGELLIVAVEAPRAQRTKSSRRTSINYSGPTKAAIEAGWDVSVSLAIE